ncbi:ead/Ea22-like family protein [Chromobacterium phragmitis]|uniref:ead/Ea22-like family protein n=1 Tax=Chromobacterium amazonense TaxID=1382803 RepID=UPI0021B7D013|nr:ead/Ea22-like family protein [Chromobacterium amazonense]MBM2883968.1 ead/Ea22-like family protein [Chromobacterium amazonense]MDE1711885.1 ead/Ea22-like family protein [Chromobacterium amazonense]
MLTPDQLADLRAAAEAATPGPWTQRGIALIEAKTGELSRASIAEVFHAAEDADYIAAANPAAIQELLAHIDAQAARIAELERDAARLDYVLANSAFLCEGTNGTGEKDYQLWTENEEEHYIVLSGLGKCFASTRAAIDAAMEQNQPPNCG